MISWQFSRRKRGKVGNILVRVKCLERVESSEHREVAQGSIFVFKAVAVKVCYVRRGKVALWHSARELKKQVDSYVYVVVFDSQGDEYITEVFN